MAKSLQQVLGWTPLTKAIKATTSGIPQPLPESFMKEGTKFPGISGKYRRTTGERRTVPLSKWGSPSRKLNLRDMGEVDVRLLHTFNNHTFDALLFSNLQKLESYELDMAFDEVKRQTEEAARRYANTRTAATLMVLNNGILYWDGDGDLLPSSSGSTESHSFQMNANNQNQLNSIITASWALTNTDIPLQLRNLKQRAWQLTGFPLKYAFYGVNVPSYMSQNNYVLDYLSRNPAMNAKYLESDHGEIPNGLFGLQWVPCYESFYEDADGTNQEIWGDDEVVFTPEPDDTWWEILQGGFRIPTTLGPTSDAVSAIQSTKLVHGTFAYAGITMDPPQILHYHGDTFLPSLKNPDVIYQADVTP